MVKTLISPRLPEATKAYAMAALGPPTVELAVSLSRGQCQLGDGAKVTACNTVRLYNSDAEEEEAM